MDNSRYVPFRRERDHGAEVYWAKGKHAAFSNLRTLRRSTAGDWYDKPDKVARLGEYTLVDVGTFENPSGAAPWIWYTEGWGAQRISPIYDKLKSHLWDAGRKPLRPIKRVTEDEVKAAQFTLDVTPTGQFDEGRWGRPLPDCVWTSCGRQGKLQRAH